MIVALALTVGLPSPAPPKSNIISWPCVYPCPASLIVTESKKPTPLLPPSMTQSRYETLATLLPPIKSVHI